MQRADATPTSWTEAVAGIWTRTHLGVKRTVQRVLGSWCVYRDGVYTGKSYTSREKAMNAAMHKTALKRSVP